MLDAQEIPYRYRDDRRKPLSETEIRDLLRLLGRPASDLLRRHDRVTRELDLAGDEAEEKLVRLMAIHPTLLQRPIGRLGGRAVIGRPPEALLALAVPPGSGPAP